MLFRCIAVLVAASGVIPAAAVAQTPTMPPVNFRNSSSAATGTDIPKLLDSYSALQTSNPSVMVENYQYVIDATNGRTAAQTLAAIHDDRTAQPYSTMNGLGALTSLFLTGDGASFSGVTPNSLTQTGYATTTLADYQGNINLGNGASFGATTFGNGTATPLAGAVNFINGTVRANSSTEPAKRIFERNGAASPLDPSYNSYSANSNRIAIDTSGIIVPSYLSSFATPAPYSGTAQWVRGFTVTPAQIAANGGHPLTAPNVGTFDASGNFTPATFGAGDYVPGIGAAPRPYRVSTDVNVPSPLRQIINASNPYADGAFPSGHTNSAYLQASGLGFLVPQQLQELFTRASDLGNNRILAGMHSPLDVMGGRIEATAIAATNIYAALYDASGNRVDWTNPANTAANGVYKAYTQTQSYLAAACGVGSVTTCVQQAQASGATANDPYANLTQDKADYTSRLSYGFAPTATNVPPTDAQVPVQAQVLLLTRLPYLTDAQRTDVLATTALRNAYPLLDGNTWDGWGRLNYVAAADGYGAFNSRVTVTMDASQGGYNAADTWRNDIGGAGGLTKQGSGSLTLTGANTYAGGTTVAGGRLVAASAHALGTGDVAVTSGTLVDAQAGVLRVGGAYTQSPGGVLEFDIADASGQTLSIAGAVIIDGRLVLDFVNGLSIGSTDLISILSDTGLSGAFSEIDVLGINGFYTDTVTRTAGGIEIAVDDVPEPATWAALGVGVLALGVARRGGEVREGRGGFRRCSRGT